MRHELKNFKEAWKSFRFKLKWGAYDGYVRSIVIMAALAIVAGVAHGVVD